MIIFIFEIAINFCESLMHTWEGSASSNSSLWISSSNCLFFWRRSNGGVGTCQRSLSGAGAQPAFRANEWSIVESLRNMLRQHPSPAGAQFRWRATEQGCLWPNGLFSGRSLFLQPPCCTQRHTDLPSLGFSLALTKEGILCYDAGFSWKQTFPVGPAAGVLGMPRYAGILGWT